MEPFVAGLRSEANAPFAVAFEALAMLHHATGGTRLAMGGGDKAAAGAYDMCVLLSGTIAETVPALVGLTAVSVLRGAAEMIQSTPSATAGTTSATAPNNAGTSDARAAETKKQGKNAMNASGASPKAAVPAAPRAKLTLDDLTARLRSLQPSAVVLSCVDAHSHGMSTSHAATSVTSSASSFSFAHNALGAQQQRQKFYSQFPSFGADVVNLHKLLFRLLECFGQALGVASKACVLQTLGDFLSAVTVDMLPTLERYVETTLPYSVGILQAESSPSPQRGSARGRSEPPSNANASSATNASSAASQPVQAKEIMALLKETRAQGEKQRAFASALAAVLMPPSLACELVQRLAECSLLYAYNTHIHAKINAPRTVKGAPPSLPLAVGSTQKHHHHQPGHAQVPADVHLPAAVFEVLRSSSFVTSHHSTQSFSYAFANQATLSETAMGILEAFLCAGSTTNSTTNSSGASQSLAGGWDPCLEHLLQQQRSVLPLSGLESLLRHIAGNHVVAGGQLVLLPIPPTPPPAPANSTTTSSTSSPTPLATTSVTSPRRVGARAMLQMIADASIAAEAMAVAAVLSPLLSPLDALQRSAMQDHLTTSLYAKAEATTARYMSAVTTVAVTAASAADFCAVALHALGHQTRDHMALLSVAVGCPRLLNALLVGMNHSYSSTALLLSSGGDHRIGRYFLFETPQAIYGRWLVLSDVIRMLCRQRAALRETVEAAIAYVPVSKTEEESGPMGGADAATPATATTRASTTSNTTASSNSSADAASMKTLTKAMAAHRDVDHHVLQPVPEALVMHVDQHWGTSPVLLQMKEVVTGARIALRPSAWLRYQLHTPLLATTLAHRPLVSDMLFAGPSRPSPSSVLMLVLEEARLRLPAAATLLEAYAPALEVEDGVASPRSPTGASPTGSPSRRNAQRGGVPGISGSARLRTIASYLSIHSTAAAAANILRAAAFILSNTNASTTSSGHNGLLAAVTEHTAGGEEGAEEGVAAAMLFSAVEQQDGDLAKLQTCLSEENLRLLLVHLATHLVHTAPAHDLVAYFPVLLQTGTTVAERACAAGKIIAAFVHDVETYQFTSIEVSNAADNSIEGDTDAASRLVADLGRRLGTSVVEAVADKVWAMSTLRKVLHQLTFRTAELPNAWFCGNLQLQLVAHYLSTAAPLPQGFGAHFAAIVKDIGGSAPQKADDSGKKAAPQESTAAAPGTPTSSSSLSLLRSTLSVLQAEHDHELGLVVAAAEAFLGSMAQHFSGPAIAEHTHMLTNLVRSLSADQLASVLQANPAADTADTLASCERRAKVPTAVLPLPHYPIRVWLLPNDNNIGNNESAVANDSLPSHLHVQNPSPASAGVRGRELQLSFALELRPDIVAAGVLVTGMVEIRGKQVTGLGDTITVASVPLTGAITVGRNLPQQPPVVRGEDASKDEPAPLPLPLAAPVVHANCTVPDSNPLLLEATLVTPDGMRYPLLVIHASEPSQAAIRSRLFDHTNAAAQSKKTPTTVRPPALRIPAARYVESVTSAPFVPGSSLDAATSGAGGCNSGGILQNLPFVSMQDISLDEGERLVRALLTLCGASSSDEEHLVADRRFILSLKPADAVVLEVSWPVAVATPTSSVEPADPFALTESDEEEDEHEAGMEDVDDDIADALASVVNGRPGGSGNTKERTVFVNVRANRIFGPSVASELIAFFSTA